MDPFMKLVDDGLVKGVIFTAHVKDVSVDAKDREISTFDIDLTGKLKRIVANKVDAIGYMFRKGNENIITFKSGNDIVAGTRPEHLQEKEIVLTRKDDKTKKLQGNWNEIFLPKTK